MQEAKQQPDGAVNVRSPRLSTDVESALAEYPKLPREVWIGTDSPVDKVRWLARRCDGSDRTISRLHDEKRELLRLLKSVHSWFMAKAPEHYNGCGLWIDVDITLRESANDEALRTGGG
jgi:hypothetical protein